MTRALAPEVRFNYEISSSTDRQSSLNRAQLTVSISTLLFPPLVQPKSPVFPLGVCTITFTGPAPDITSVVSFTFSCWSLTTVALRGVELIRTSDAETKWLPFTVSIEPCCTSAKVIVLGEREPISGAGLALPHNGLRVLLQPTIETARANRQAQDRPQVRKRMGDTPLGWDSPSGCVSTNIRIRGRNRCSDRCRPSANVRRPAAIS